MSVKEFAIIPQLAIDATEGSSYLGPFISTSEMTYIEVTSTFSSENLRIDTLEGLLEFLKMLLQHENIFIDDELKQLIIIGEIPFYDFETSYKIALAVKTFLDYHLSDVRTDIAYIELKVFRDFEAETLEHQICIKVHVPIREFNEVSRIWDLTVDYLLEEFNEDDLEKIELLFTRL